METVPGQYWLPSNEYEKWSSQSVLSFASLGLAMALRLGGQLGVHLAPSRSCGRRKEWLPSYQQPYNNYAKLDQ